MITLFVVACAVQAVVWGYVYPRAFSESAPKLSSADHPVSVIVCFRNEANHLHRCLSGILDQHYPTFELIAVDDNSTDASADIVREIAATDTRVRLVDPGRTKPGKRDALAAGIQAARYDHLLLTDADCAPATPHWLSLMTAPLAENELVLGASPYRYHPGWLGLWQRYETTHVALQYLGFARLGRPYMGVGRNLAYRKSFFVRGGPTDLPGGDDDLLVNAGASNERTALVADPAAWTYSSPLLSWRRYFRQKLRHQSVGPRYQFRDRMLLTGVALSHGLFFLLGLFLLFTSYFMWAIYAYVLRCGFLYGVFRKSNVRHFFGGSAGALGVVLADMAYAPFTLFLLFGSLWGSKKW